MRKLLVVLMALALLVGVHSVVFADANAVAYTGGDSLGKLRAVTTINTDSTGYDTTTLSATHIPLGKCEILGYHANAVRTSGFMEGLFTLRDDAGGGLDTYIIAENEVAFNLPVAEMFPKGLELQRGLTIHQGPGTSVTVYYIQVRP